MNVSSVCSLSEYVKVYKLDRFSRNKYEMAIHRKRLKDNGVKIVSAMENIPDSPEGILLESLLEGMNQYYSADCFYGHNYLNQTNEPAQVIYYLRRLFLFLFPYHPVIEFRIH